jgi:hypothetical protein
MFINIKECVCTCLVQFSSNVTTTTQISVFIAAERHCTYDPGHTAVGYTHRLSTVVGYTHGLSTVVGYTHGLSTAVGYTHGLSTAVGYTHRLCTAVGYTHRLSERLSIHC